MKKNKEEIALGIDSYMPLNWALKISKQNKLTSLQSTSTEMQEAARSAPIRTTFRGQQISIAPINICSLNANVVLDDSITQKYAGKYDVETNSIKINPTILVDGKMSCETVSHESVHKIQMEMAKTAHLYYRGSLEYDFLKLLEYSNPKAINKFNVFGIEFSGTMYMSGTRIPRISSDNKSSAFYSLTPAERHAFLTADRIITKLPDGKHLDNVNLENPSYGELQIAQALKELCKEYNCYEMSIQQIFQAIDNAQTYIAFGYGLTSDLEANMAYDMAALMEYENSELTQEEALRILDDRLDAKIKSLELSKVGFELIGSNTRFGEYVILNDKPTNYIADIDEIEAMPTYEQINNPLAIANFAAESGVDPRIALHCPEAFEEWLFSEDSMVKLSTTTQNELETVLGERFSMHNREMEAQLCEDRIDGDKVNVRAHDIMNIETSERGFVFESLEEDLGIRER